MGSRGHTQKLMALQKKSNIYQVYEILKKRVLKNDAFIRKTEKAQSAISVKLISSSGTHIFPPSPKKILRDIKTHTHSIAAQLRVSDIPQRCKCLT